MSVRTSSGEVLAIRHVDFEHLGTFEAALARRGYAVRYVDAATDDIAALDALAPRLLVVLGGPIGAYEEALYPFLLGELRLIERRLAAGMPILGICLGCQLIARALGARVYPGKAKEIGWSPIALTEAGRASPLAHLAGCDHRVLHWHGDTFDLPDGVELLASTKLTAHQAFRRGTNALALHRRRGFSGGRRCGGFGGWQRRCLCDCLWLGAGAGLCQASGARTRMPNSPGMRDRGSRAIADHRARHRAHRSQDDRTRHRSQSRASGTFLGVCFVHRKPRDQTPSARQTSSSAP